jgi:hypothetical protein
MCTLPAATEFGGKFYRKVMAGTAANRWFNFRARMVGLRPGSLAFRTRDVAGSAKPPQPTLAYAATLAMIDVTVSMFTAMPWENATLQYWVGGELTLTALPHHRTCGSASGGST